MTQTQKEKLMAAAQAAIASNAFGAKNIYSAAVLTKKGNIYASTQYYSDTLSLTLHSEQAALAHAAAHGEIEVTAIAVTSNEPQGAFSYPCHMCKQLLWESHLRSQLPIIIINFDKWGRVEEIDLTQMMAYPWPSKKNAA